MAFDAIPSTAKAKTIHAVDLFCGAGGTSTGMLSAIEDLGWKPKLIAINHWNVAIDTHYKNHPDAVPLKTAKALCTALLS